MNRLVHLAEFQKVLDDYHMSESSTKVLHETRLALLAAPTSSGRNTIIRELVKTGEYHFVVSDTTRKPRINDGVPEKNGTEYWFRSEEEVLADLRAGRFLEAAIIHNQQVSGISIRELTKARDTHQIAVTDIEMVGVENIVKAKPDTLVFFILPPDFASWQKRLLRRGSITKQERQRRMESAAREFAHALENPYYTFIVNDTIEHAIRHIHQIATSGTLESFDQSAGRAVAEQLLADTKEWLKTR